MPPFFLQGVVNPCKLLKIRHLPQFSPLDAFNALQRFSTPDVWKIRWKFCNDMLNIRYDIWKVHCRRENLPNLRLFPLRTVKILVHNRYDYDMFLDAYTDSGQFVPNLGVKVFCNDLDPELINFHRFVQDPEQRPRLVWRWEQIPHSREMRLKSKEMLKVATDPFERAVWFFVRSQQGFNDDVHGGVCQKKYTHHG